MLALPMLLSTNIRYCIANIYFSILLYFCILSTNSYNCCAHRHIICLWLRQSLFFYSACDFILILFLHLPIFCHDTKPVLLLSLSCFFYIFSGHYLGASSGILCILAYKSCALHLFAALHPLRGQYYLPNVLSVGISSVQVSTMLHASHQSSNIVMRGECLTPGTPSSHR